MSDCFDHAFEAYESLDRDDWEDSGYSTHKTFTCKHCHMNGLKWKNTSSGWRLFKGEVLHECLVRRR